jgi:hypothetical protein
MGGEELLAWLRKRGPSSRLKDRYASAVSP